MYSLYRIIQNHLQGSMRRKSCNPCLVTWIGRHRMPPPRESPIPQSPASPILRASAGAYSVQLYHLLGQHHFLLFLLHLTLDTLLPVLDWGLSVRAQSGTQSVYVQSGTQSICDSTLGLRVFMSSLGLRAFVTPLLDLEYLCDSSLGLRVFCVSVPGLRIILFHLYLHLDCFSPGC